jgi:hypothetical protein
MLFDLAALERKDTPAEPTGTSEIPLYADDLLPALQATLAVLADLDIQREIQQDCLEEWSGPDEVKRCLMAESEASWQSARAACAVPSPASQPPGRGGRTPLRPRAVRAVRFRSCRSSFYSAAGRRRACEPSRTSSMILATNGSRSAGERLVMIPRSVTTASSRQSPPALITSVLID